MTLKTSSLLLLFLATAVSLQWTPEQCGMPPSKYGMGLDEAEQSLKPQAKESSADDDEPRAPIKKPRKVQKKKKPKKSKPKKAKKSNKARRPLSHGSNQTLSDLDSLSPKRRKAKPQKGGRKKDKKGQDPNLVHEDYVTEFADFEQDLNDFFAGLPQHRRQRRSAIRGGQKVHASQFPFIVGLGEVDASGLMVGWCTGALISPSHVLTAAHCFAPRSSALVYVGLDHLDADKSYTSGTVTNHPQYKIVGNDLHTNDLSIVHLAKPVVLSETVYPLCLAERAPQMGNPMQSIGYGRFRRDTRENAERDQNLRLVDVKSRDCTGQESVQFVCTGSATAGTESGDSGGPLISRVSNRYVTYGALSMGSSFGVGEDAYSMYTPVEFYCDWIKKLTKGKAHCRDF